MCVCFFFFFTFYNYIDSHIKLLSCYNFIAMFSCNNVCDTRSQSFRMKHDINMHRNFHLKVLYLCVCHTNYMLALKRAFCMWTRVERTLESIISFYYNNMRNEGDDGDDDDDGDEDGGNDDRTNVVARSGCFFLLIVEKEFCHTRPTDRPTNIYDRSPTDVLTCENGELLGRITFWRRRSPSSRPASIWERPFWASVPWVSSWEVSRSSSLSKLHRRPLWI